MRRPPTRGRRCRTRCGRCRGRNSPTGTAGRGSHTSRLPIRPCSGKCPAHKTRARCRCRSPRRPGRRSPGRPTPLHTGMCRCSTFHARSRGGMPLQSGARAHERGAARVGGSAAKRTEVAAVPVPAVVAVARRLQHGVVVARTPARPVARAVVQHLAQVLVAPSADVAALTGAEMRGLVELERGLARSVAAAVQWAPCSRVVGSVSC